MGVMGQNTGPTPDTATPQAVLKEFGAGFARVAASYERNAALREELLQEISLAVVTALPSLKDPARLRAFVFRIAHNCAVRHAVRNMRLRRTEGEYAAGAEKTVPPSGEDSDNRQERLMEAVRSLKLPYRQVITLLLEGLSYDEIARAAGISVSNVGVRINRAKAELKALLTHE